MIENIPRHSAADIMATRHGDGVGAAGAAGGAGGDGVATSAMSPASIVRAWLTENLLAAPNDSADGGALETRLVLDEFKEEFSVPAQTWSQEDRRQARLVADSL